MKENLIGNRKQILPENNEFQNKKRIENMNQYSVSHLFWRNYEGYQHDHEVHHCSATLITAKHGYRNVVHEMIMEVQFLLK